MGGLAAVAGSKGAAAKSATDRLAELHERAENQERRLAELRREIGETDRVDANDLDQTLRNFDPLWEQMTTWEREKFIRALVEQVRYDGTTGTVTVGFRSGGHQEPLRKWNSTNSQLRFDSHCIRRSRRMAPNATETAPEAGRVAAGDAGACARHPIPGDAPGGGSPRLRRPRPPRLE